MEKADSLVKQKEFLADIQGNLGSGPTTAVIKPSHFKQMTSPVTDCFLIEKGSAID